MTTETRKTAGKIILPLILCAYFAFTLNIRSESANANYLTVIDCIAYMATIFMLIHNIPLLPKALPSIANSDKATNCFFNFVFGFSTATFAASFAVSSLREIVISRPVSCMAHIVMNLVSLAILLPLLTQRTPLNSSENEDEESRSIAHREKFETLGLLALSTITVFYLLLISKLKWDGDIISSLDLLALFATVFIFNTILSNREASLIARVFPSLADKQKAISNTVLFILIFALGITVISVGYDEFSRNKYIKSTVFLCMNFVSITVLLLRYIQISRNFANARAA